MEVSAKRGNNNKKKPFNNVKKKAPKKKIKMERYTKDFSSFEDGIDDICDKSEYLFDLLQEYGVDAKTPKTYNEFKEFIISVISDYFPDKEYKKDLLWEFSISGNQITVKTNKYIGFGFRPKVNNVMNNQLVSYTFFIDVYGDRQQDLIDFLEETGYEKYIPKYLQRKQNEEEKSNPEE